MALGGEQSARCRCLAMLDTRSSGCREAWKESPVVIARLVSENDRSSCRLDSSNDSRRFQHRSNGRIRRRRRRDAMNESQRLFSGLE